MKAKNQQLNERVKKVASGLIFRQGIRGWNMDGLAAEVGVTKRTLYKMISSKEELIEIILIDFIKDVQAGIGAIITSEKDYPAAIGKIITMFPDVQSGFRLDSLGEIFLEYPAIEEKVHALRDELTTGLVSFLQRGIDAGYLRKDMSAGFILQLFQALVLYFVKFSPPGEYPARIRDAFSCLVDGIRER